MAGIRYRSVKLMAGCAVIMLQRKVLILTGRQKRKNKNEWKQKKLRLRRRKQAQAAEAAAQSVASGQEVIDYACQFIGNPYVWGGTSLTDGADCSGFVQSVYAHFGISLPRTSYEQRSAGYEVSYEDAQPGILSYMKDMLVCI